MCTSGKCHQQHQPLPLLLTGRLIEVATAFTSAKPGSRAVPSVTFATGSPVPTECTPRWPRGSRSDTYSCGSLAGRPDDGHEGPTCTNRWLPALMKETRSEASEPKGT